MRSTTTCMEDKVRELQATIYPLIILDEFQDTDASQWRVVEALGVKLP